jgi:hypothetical protein
MTIIRFLHSLEEIIYEMLLWFALIPKTVYKLVVDPRWMVAYIREELEKKEEDRFNEYTSPVILLLVTVALPYKFILNSPLKEKIDIPFIDKFFETADEETRLFALGTYFLIFPLLLSVGLQLVFKKPISRSELKSIFLMQCYCIVPAQLLANIPFTFVDYTIDWSIWAFIGILFLFSFFWFRFLYTQTIVIKEIYNIATGKALTIYLLLYFLCSILIFSAFLFLESIYYKLI